MKNGGRPTVPLRTFAAMVLLKFMYDLPYRELCAQVRDRISWRVFCHIPITARVPDYSTICKLVHRFGPEAVEEMNEAVLRHSYIGDSKSCLSRSVGCGGKFPLWYNGITEKERGGNLGCRLNERGCSPFCGQ
ncbi:MAG: transposase [Bacillota bacterium]